MNQQITNQQHTTDDDDLYALVVVDCGPSTLAHDHDP
jgi:hypothetical protein